MLSSIPQTDITTIDWEVRTGVTAGSGGTLVASGTRGATVSATGRNGFGRPEYNVRATGLNFNLAAGTYFLGGKVGGNGSSNDVYISTTSGTNSIGSPGGNNGNSFWDSTSFGSTWQASTAIFGAGTWDLSMGVTGTVVPEPATMTVLAVSALALLRRRKNA